MVMFSRYGWALRVAKFTAKRLLSIVSDKDHIAFYTFNKTTDSISCNPLLERARLKYINYLSGKIDKIESYGKSRYSENGNTYIINGRVLIFYWYDIR